MPCLPVTPVRCLPVPEARRPAVFVLFLLLAAASLAPLSETAARAQSLLGSRASLEVQNQGAAEEGFTYLRTASEVREFVELELLVRLPGNADYWVAGASFPYARPEVKRFIERLAGQYRDTCGERLVVTSLTRPVTLQPYNASEISVHPTGMAVDLRKSRRASCRRFLEKTLLWLESQGAVEATRERHPAHYHVSVFGTPYSRYLARQGEEIEFRTVVRRGAAGSGKISITRAKGSSRGKASSRASHSVAKRYRVRSGDNLWQIAQKHGTTVASLKRANGMKSTRLRAGQVLSIPAVRAR